MIIYQQLLWFQVTGNRRRITVDVFSIIVGTWEYVATRPQVVGNNTDVTIETKLLSI